MFLGGGEWLYAEVVMKCLCLDGCMLRLLNAVGVFAGKIVC